MPPTTGSGDRGEAVRVAPLLERETCATARGQLRQGGCKRERQAVGSVTASPQRGRSPALSPQRCHHNVVTATPAPRPKAGWGSPAKRTPPLPPLARTGWSCGRTARRSATCARRSCVASAARATAPGDTDCRTAASSLTGS